LLKVASSLALNALKERSLFSSAISDWEHSDLTIEFGCGLCDHIRDDAENELLAYVVIGRGRRRGRLAISDRDLSAVWQLGLCSAASLGANRIEVAAVLVDLKVPHRAEVFSTRSTVSKASAMMLVLSFSVTT
jgi:hypothetical protein